MQRMVQKFSMVFLARGEKTEIFRSLEEVPDGVRQELAETAKKSQIETLIIANEKGRELLEHDGMQRGRQEQRGFTLKPAAKWALLAVLAGLVGVVLTIAWSFR